MSLACVTSTTMYALKAMQVTRVEITQAFLIPVSKCHKFTLQLQMCCFLSKKKKKKIYIYITASLLLHSTDKNCTKEATFMALKKCTKKWRQVHLECPNSSPAHTAICRSLSCYDLNLKRYKKRKKETGGNVKERKTYAWYKNSK